MDFKTQGNELYQAGKPQLAVAAYTRGVDFVETAEDNQALPSEQDKGCLHLLYCNRSMVHLVLAQPEAAMRDAERGIELDPSYGKAYARRAAVLIDLFELEAALLDLAKAVELDPKLAPSLEENRLRASGSKWVPNCYLRKQLELQKKHRCHYVWFWRGEEGEKDGEEVAVPLKLSDASRVAQATRTGSGTEGLLNDVVDGGTVMVSKEVQVSGDTRIDRYQIQAQLAREFGPRKTFTRAASIKDLFSAVEKGHHDKVTALLAGGGSGLDVNTKDNNGKTPLHWAAHSDYDHVATILLEHGAKLSTQDNYDQTALHTAAFQDSLRSMHIFLNHLKGAGGLGVVLVKDKSGSRALDLICPDDEVYGILREATENASSPP